MMESNVDSKNTKPFFTASNVYLTRNHIKNLKPDVDDEIEVKLQSNIRPYKVKLFKDILLLAKYASDQNNENPDWIVKITNFYLEIVKLDQNGCEIRNKGNKTKHNNATKNKLAMPKEKINSIGLSLKSNDLQ